MKHLFVAGFDFGTSFSKVVLRDQLTGLAKAVSFGDEHIGLLPSLLRTKNGEVFGPLDCVDGEIISFPKLIAADLADQSQRFRSLYADGLERFRVAAGIKEPVLAVEVLLTRYFYSVIRGIRDFIATDSDWADSDPATDPLMVQLAVPTGLMGVKDGPLESCMRNALRAAHFLAHYRKGTPTLADLLQVKDGVAGLPRNALETLDKSLFIYPEVAGGVQAVLRSRNTAEGKYITMDVGAGTVDLNAFYRHSAGLDYWACQVVPLGFARIRFKGSGTGPDNLEDSQVMAELRQAIANLMEQAFRYQPKKVLGNGIPPWEHHVFPYIWGGGSAHPPYERHFLAALRDCGVAVADHANRLPVPGENFSLPHDVGDFGRLAVAFGLSFHHAKLDGVRLPSELQTFSERYPGYWQVSTRTAGTCRCYANPDCKRCGGTGFVSADESLVPNWQAICLAIGNQQNGAPSGYRGPYYEALEGCLQGFHRTDARIVEKVECLNRIETLLRRPELAACEGIIGQGRLATLTNVQGLGGEVRVVPGSAVLASDGVRVVSQVRKNESVEVALSSPNGVLVMKAVNEAEPESLVRLGCGVKRDTRGRFQLHVTKLPHLFTTPGGA